MNLWPGKKRMARLLVIWLSWLFFFIYPRTSLAAIEGPPYFITDSEKQVINQKIANHPWAQDAFDYIRNCSSKSHLLSKTDTQYNVIITKSLNIFYAALVWRLKGDTAAASRAKAGLESFRNNIAPCTCTEPYGTFGACADVVGSGCIVSGAGSGAANLTTPAIRNIALAYDLLADYYSSSSFEDYLEEVIAARNIGGRLRGSSAYAAVGLVLGDSGLFTKATNAYKNFVNQYYTAGDSLADYTYAATGPNYENRFYFSSVGTIIKLIDRGHQMGLIGTEGSEESLRQINNSGYYRAALGRIFLVFPNGQYGLPTIGDSYPDLADLGFFIDRQDTSTCSEQSKEGWKEVDGYETISTIYSDYPKANYFKWALSLSERKNWHSLIWGPTSLAGKENPGGQSVILDTKGAVLKSDSSLGYWNSNSIYALLTTQDGRAGSTRNHAHYDSLSLIIMGNKKEQMVDLGRKAGREDWWGHRTADHATVTVDNQNQQLAADPAVVFFENRPEIKIVQISALDAYPDRTADYRRTVGVTSEYVLDFFRVQSNNSSKRRLWWRTIGWGKYTLPGIDLSTSHYSPPVGHFLDVKQADVDGNFSFTVNTGMKSWLLGRSGSRVFHGTVDLEDGVSWEQYPSYSNIAESIIVQRDTDKTVFGSLHDVYPYEIQSINAWRDNNSEVALKITGDSFNDYFVHSLRSTSAKEATNPTDAKERIAWEKRFGYLRVQGNRLDGVGDLTSFTLYAPAVDKNNVWINGSKVGVAKSAGYISYQKGSTVPTLAPTPSLPTFQQLLSSWLTSQHDQNGDGKVNSLDFGLLILNQ